MAYDALINRVNLRKENMPFLATEGTMQLLRDGHFYVSGRDKHFRPVLVMKANVMNNFTGDPKEVFACHSAILTYVITHMLVEGHIENVITVIDLKDLGVFSINYGLIK